MKIIKLLFSDYKLYYVKKNILMYKIVIALNI